jgi:DNA (cytosine-5)-methyltransferase 1
MAGKRKGTEDSRHLWPEMLRVIEEVKPRWVIGENVFGLNSMEVEHSDIDVESDTDSGTAENADVDTAGLVWTIKQDLDKIGYDCEVLCIPACATGAWHRRDRLWFVAHAPQQGRQRRERREHTQLKERVSGRGNKRNDTHARCKGLERGRYKKREYSSQCDRGQGTNWNKNWLEVATRLCGVDDGLPAELDGFKLSKAGHRVARLKGLGNSICPQVVIEIMQCIKQIDSKD